MNERPFGKPTQPKALEQADPISAQPRGIAWPAQCRLRVAALEGAAGETSSAPAARLRERPDDVIADVDLRDVGTDGRHDPRDLVTQHRWCRHDVVRGEQEVRVAEA